MYGKRAGYRQVVYAPIVDYRCIKELAVAPNLKAAVTLNGFAASVLYHAFCHADRQNCKSPWIAHVLCLLKIVVGVADNQTACTKRPCSDAVFG